MDHSLFLIKKMTYIGNKYNEIIDKENKISLFFIINSLLHCRAGTLRKAIVAGRLRAVTYAATNEQ